MANQSRYLEGGEPRFLIELSRAHGMESKSGADAQSHATAASFIPAPPGVGSFKFSPKSVCKEVREVAAQPRAKVWTPTSCR